MKLDELAPSLAAMAKPLTPTKPGAPATTDPAAQKPLSGTAATPTGAAATQGQSQQATTTTGGQQQQKLGAVDIVNALKDPQVALQLKAMKQKMPGGNLDAMVDPKGAADQQKHLTDLSKALDTLKKNAGIQ